MRIVTVNSSRRNKRLFILQCGNEAEIDSLKTAVETIKEHYKNYPDKVLESYVHTLEKIFARFSNKYERKEEGVAFSACIFEEEMIKLSSRSLVFLCLQAADIEERKLESIIREKEEHLSALREKAHDSGLDYNAKRDDETEDEELEEERKKRKAGLK